MAIDGAAFKDSMQSVLGFCIFIGLPVAFALYLTFKENSFLKAFFPIKADVFKKKYPKADAYFLNGATCSYNFSTPIYIAIEFYPDDIVVYNYRPLSIDPMNHQTYAMDLERGISIRELNLSFSDYNSKGCRMTMKNGDMAIEMHLDSEVYDRIKNFLRSKNV